MGYAGERHTASSVAFTIIVMAAGHVTFALAQSASENPQGTNIDNSITFNVPLTVMWRTGDGRNHELTAFRSRHNDEILDEVKNGNLRRVPKLRWVSPGRPVFVGITPSKTADENETNAVRKYLRFTPSGFHSFIEMLTEEQKILLARQASEETHVNITAKQIVNLPLTKFECLLVFYDEKTKKKQLIKGEVGDFKTFPLRMDFEAPSGTSERERLINTQLDDLVFNCRLSIQAQITRTNTLSITGQQLQDVRIEDKLFGNASEVYVTRHQMTELASEMYSTLNIMEDYEVPESAFSDAFVEEVIRQLASRQFSQLPIETVLAAISTYSVDFSGDLVADRITSDLGNVLKIEQVGDKSRIVAAWSRATSSDRATSTSGRASVEASASVMGFAGAAMGAAAEFAHNNAEANSEDIGSLDDQLKELNRLSRHEAEWKVEGNKVIPKSLNVAKLSRTRIGNRLTFNRVRRKTSDAAFDYGLKMYLHTAELSVAEQPVSNGNPDWKQELVAELQRSLLESEQQIKQRIDSVVSLHQQSRQLQLEQAKTSTSIYHMLNVSHQQSFQLQLEQVKTSTSIHQTLNGDCMPCKIVYGLQTSRARFSPGSAYCSNHRNVNGPNPASCDPSLTTTYHLNSNYVCEADNRTESTTTTAALPASSVLGIILKMYDVSTYTGAAVSSYWGVIVSQNFPQPYTHALTSRWTIVCPLSVCVIDLRFSYFATESCCDHVRVYDGINSNAPLLADLSGVKAVAPSVVSTQRAIFISFTSDGSTAYPGFLAVYRALIPGANSDTCSAYRPAVVNNYRGSISSTNYPNNYNNGDNNSWLISSSSSSTVVTLSVLYFYTERDCDFLRLYDGSNENAPLLAQLSGVILPTPFTIKSTQQNMYVTFKTDHSVVYSGFSAVYN